jgi:hydrogenase maturation protein HypF
MISRELNSPLARGVGRWFDAFGAIGLSMPHARYEGEVATLWNMAADPNEHGHYPIVVRDGITPWEIDPRPVLRSAVLDLIGGVRPSIVSARFHNTLAAVTIEVAQAASRGELPIVLTGGCFQNALLAERVIDGLHANRVYMNHHIPPGDGGIALGQALIADAIYRQPSTANRQPEEELTCV